MPLIPVDSLIPLQDHQDKIRNICVLAHVDHGKTTLSDQLISSNGIISQPMAGKLRYLDFLQEEQAREITMKSAAIALLFQRSTTVQTDEQSQVIKENYLINLIDSPGHVDFSSEVSTAVRITDGALVLVDAVEGVCIQTHAVLKQAYQEKVKPCLVLNKIDRLIGELHMTPLEAYQHLKKVIEQVNVITGTLTSEEIIVKETSSETLNLNSDELDQLDKIGTDYYFSPQKGNVAFTTAYDGWGFTIQQFVDICNKKTGIKKSILEKTLWGDYYYHPKEKKIYTTPKSNLTPMFVTFVLNSVWEVYKSITPEWIDRDRLSKIINALQLQVNERDFQNTDPKIVLKAILNSWLPLSDAILGMVVDHLPNPVDGQKRRMEKIFKLSTISNKVSNNEDDDEVNKEQLEKGQLELFKNTMECNKSEDSDIVAFVAKVISYAHKNVATSIIHRPIPPRRVKPSAVPKNRAINNSNETTTATNETSSTSTPNSEPLPPTTPAVPTIPTPTPTPIPTPIPTPTANNANDDEFIAVVRVFSGTLKKGSKVNIMGPRYDPLKPTHDIVEFEITQLFILMGNSLEPVDRVPAGNICGIGGGIGNYILKSATISSSKFCPPLANMSFVSSPIVKVAIEPENLTDMPKLLHGLKLLNQSDPLVEVYVQETGEHVIVASGELHLERCISDLKDTFAKIPVNVSSPIVPFRETIISNPTTSVNNNNNSPVINSNTMDSNNKSPVLDGSTNEIIQFKTANKKVTISMKAIPLPKNIADLIEQNAKTLRDLFLGGKKENKEISDNKTSKKEAEAQEREDFKTILAEELSKSGDIWKNEINNIWSFGSKHIGPNILLNHIPGYSNSPLWKPALSRGFQKKTKITNNEDDEDDNQEQQEEETDENEDNNASSVKEMVLLKDDEKFLKIFELDNSIVSGFQMATNGGPICDEPMMGVCLVVENIEFAESVTMSDSYGPLSGQMISATKEACRIAFQTKPQRIMEAMYLCEVQVSSVALGKMYSVLSSRRARIITEGIKEGTPIFCIQARLPVAESFGFNQQIMIKTSGAASTQLFFDNYWEVIPVDPYYMPTTEEELEENGVNIASLGNNIATQYMNLIRKRKGLMVEEKLVEHADKQRTLSKNK